MPDKLSIKLSVDFDFKSANTNLKKVLDKLQNANKLDIIVDQKVFNKTLKEIENLKAKLNKNGISLINSTKETKKVQDLGKQIGTIREKLQRQFRESVALIDAKQQNRALEETFKQQQKNIEQRKKLEQEYEQWWLKNLKNRELKEKQIQQNIQSAIASTIKRRIEEEKKWNEAQEKAISKYKEAEIQRIQKLGKNIGIFSRINFDDDEAIKRQIQQVYGLNSSIVSYQRTLDSAGNSIVKFKVATEQANNQVKINTGIVDKNTQAIYQQGEVLKVNANRLVGFAQNMLHSIKAMASWGLAASVLYGNLRRLREGISFIKDLNKETIQIQMVTKMSADQVNELVRSYSKLANQLGTTTDAVTKSVTGFFRQGLSIKEVEDRLTTTIKLANALGINVDIAAEKVTAGVNSLGVDSERLADVVTRIGAVAGTSGEEILTIIQRAGATAKATNITLEQLSSIAGVISESTRLSAETIGAALNTILSKFQQVDSLTGEINEDYGKIINALESIGIRTTNIETGQLRNIVDILSDLGQKWDSLDQKTQAYITGTIGVRQFNRFASLLGNISRQQELLNEAMNSGGELSKQYAIYLDSVEASANRAKNAFQQMWINALNSDAIKYFYTFSETTAKVIDSIGLLNTIIGTLTATILIANNTTRSWIMNLSTGVVKAGSLSGAINILTGSITNLKLATFATASALTLGLSAAITLVITGITKWIGKIQEVKRKQKELVQTSLATAKQLKDEVDQLKKLKEEYNNVVKSGGNLEEVQKKLAKSFPELADKVNNEGEVLATNIEKIDSLISKKQELLETNAILAKQKAEKELPELEKELQKLEEEYKKLDQTSNVRIRYIEGVKYEEDITDELLVKKQANIEAQQKIVDKIIENNEAINFANALLSQNTQNLNDNTEAINNNLNALNIHLKSFEELQKSFDETTSKLQFYYKALKELNSEEGLSADVKEEIIQNYPQLMAYLSDETSLRKQLNKLIADESKIQEDTYYKMLLQNEEFYNAKIKGNEEFIKKLGEFYNIDLNNYKNLAQLKKAIDTQLISNLSSKWVKYFNALVAGNRVIENGLVHAAMRGDKNANEILIAFNQFKNLEDRFKKLTLDIGGIDFKGINIEKDKKKDKEKYFTELSDTYLEITERIESLNNEIEKNKILLQDENLKNQDKIRILNEQQQKYKQLQSALKALNSERVKERSKIKEQIKNLVEFNDAGEVVKYNQSEYKDEQADLIKQYQELGDEINQTKLEIISLDNEMNNNIKTMKDLAYDLAKELIENEKKLAKTRLDNHEKELKRIKTEAEERIKDYEEEIKKLEEKADLQKEINERKKREYELDKQRQLIENIKKEKNVRIFKDGQWQWVADPRKLREETEKYEEMKKDFQEWEKENDRRHQIELLEQKIQEERKKVRQQEILFDKEKEIFEEHYNDIESLVEQKMAKLRQVYGDEWAKIIEVLDAEKLAAQITGKYININEITSETRNNIIKSLIELKDRFAELGYEQGKNYIDNLLEMIRDGKGEITAEMFDLISNLDKVMKVIDLKMQYAVADNDKERQRIHEQANAIRATLPSDVADLIDADVSLNDALENIQEILVGNLVNIGTSSLQPSEAQQLSTGGEYISGGFYNTGSSPNRTRDDDSSRKTGEDGTPGTDRNPYGSNSSYSEKERQENGYSKDEWDEIERISIERDVDLGVAKDMHETNKKYGTQYHTGGFVGGKAFNPKHEEIAKLLKGELVLTPNHLDNFIKNISLSIPKINNKLNSSNIINYNFDNMTVKTNDARGFIKNLKTLTAM